MKLFFVSYNFFKGPFFTPFKPQPCLITTLISQKNLEIVLHVMNLISSRLDPTV
jgi:hypothetical protein